VVGSREQLDQRYAEAVTRFGDGPVTRPPYWGGYRIAPDTFEFWQGRQGRLHDRFRYRFSPTTAAAGGQPWRLERLAP
jgi:pyridoxamine 5'-phosphate oxidase